MGCLHKVDSDRSQYLGGGTQIPRRHQHGMPFRLEALGDGQEPREVPEIQAQFPGQEDTTHGGFPTASRVGPAALADTGLTAPMWTISST